MLQQVVATYLILRRGPQCGAYLNSAASHPSTTTTCPSIAAQVALNGYIANPMVKNLPRNCKQNCIKILNCRRNTTRWIKVVAARAAMNGAYQFRGQTKKVENSARALSAKSINLRMYKISFIINWCLWKTQFVFKFYADLQRDRCPDDEHVRLLWIPFVCLQEILQRTGDARVFRPSFVDDGGRHDTLPNRRPPR